MKRITLSLVILLLLVGLAIPGCPGGNGSNGDGNGDGGGASFSLSNLSISSGGEVLANESITISVNVRNTGNAQGSYNVVLNIDGTQEDSEMVTLGPGSSQDVRFNVSKQITGTYNVDIGNLSGSFSVYPTVEGPEPSYRVAAFYYPWYGNPEFNGRWWHWTQGDHTPPDDISSDYYPVLGAYSSTDPQVVAQHMAWLRQAGTGVIITSWWGQDSFEDRAVPLLLDMANRYSIKVAFHIEPYSGRSADGLVQDVQYIYEHYGSHPAFFRTIVSSRWSPDDNSKGVFFLWAAGISDYTGGQGNPVEFSYWQEAMDTIHSLTEGGIVIGHGSEGYMADEAHFDGAYNYITLKQGGELDFGWALSLPAGTLYVPSVAPGFSDLRLGFPIRTYLLRQDGDTYMEQWNAALSTGIEPWIVTIATFNEWHEGTQIEPAAENKNDGKGYDYASYVPLAEDGYLTLTKQLSEQFLSIDWASASYTVRFEITTTSDWTFLELISGGKWSAPDVISVSEEAESFRLVGDRITLTQSLDSAMSGNEVEAVVDMLLIDLNTDDPIAFNIGRGHLGSTRVVVSILVGETWVVIDDFVWDGIAYDNDNTLRVEIASEEIISSS